MYSGLPRAGQTASAVLGQRRSQAEGSQAETCRDLKSEQSSADGRLMCKTGGPPGVQGPHASILRVVTSRRD